MLTVIRPNNFPTKKSGPYYCCLLLLPLPNRSCIGLACKGSSSSLLHVTQSSLSLSKSTSRSWSSWMASKHTIACAVDISEGKSEPSSSLQLGQGTPHLWHKGILWNQGRVAGSCTVYRIWLCGWIGSFLLHWSLHHSTSLFVALSPTSQSPVATFTSSLVSLEFRCSKACTSSSIHKNWPPPHAFCRRISSVRHIPLVWCRSSKYTATKQYHRAVKEMITGLLGASQRAIC